MATYNSNSQVGFLSFATTKSAFKNEGEPQSVSVTAKDTCDTLRRGGSICPHSSTMFTFPVLTSLKEAGVRTAKVLSMRIRQLVLASSACPYMEPRASGCLCSRNHYFQPQSGWVTLSHTTPTHCAQLQRFRIHIIQNVFNYGKEANGFSTSLQQPSWGSGDKALGVQHTNSLWNQPRGRATDKGLGTGGAQELSWVHQHHARL